MNQLVFDEGMARALDVVYRTRDALRRRALIRAALAAAPGERIVDVGCGPGFYVAELLEAVGPEGSVTGIDASEQMLAMAANRVEGASNVSFHQADATALPLPDASADAALSVQVLEYVADVETGLAELRRVVRPGGRVLVWDVDWSTLSWHSADRERMSRVLAAWDEHLADPVLPRTLAGRLRAAGFEDVAMEAHAFATAELTPDAYGGSLLPLLQGFVTGRVPDELRDGWAAEQRELGERGEFYFAVVQCCFTATRP